MKLKKDATFEELSNDVKEIKELIFKFQDKLYPATNKYIEYYKGTMSLHDVSTKIRTELELLDRVFNGLKGNSDNIKVHFCPKCNCWTFHERSGPKTARCIVCRKRKYRCKKCGFEFIKGIYIGDVESRDFDGTPEIKTIYGCPKCKTRVYSITYGNQ